MFRQWQSRPREDAYPVLFLDCMMVKIRDPGTLQRRACYLPLATGMDRRARRARHAVPGIGARLHSTTMTNPASTTPGCLRHDARESILNRGGAAFHRRR
jgi:Transposase, Mutator family